MNKLISKGANDEKKYFFDWNYGLYYACKGGNMNIAELIISKGADYEFDNKTYNEYILKKAIIKKFIVTLPVLIEDILRLIANFL